MKTILVPLDGSALAEQVLPYIRLMAPSLAAQVRLFHAIPEWAIGGVFETAALYGPGGLILLPQEIDSHSTELLRKQAEEYLATQAAPLRAAGLDVTTEVRFGAAAELIIEAAAASSVALVALATHGYSGLKRWALGSVADKVAHVTNTPLFIVRGAEQATAARPIKRIMVPLDGSALARQALPLAAELAVQLQAELLPLTVVVPPIGEAIERLGPYKAAEAIMPMRAQLFEELDSVVEALQQHHVPITPVIAHGFAAETIIAEAARQQVDLLIMATHGRSGLKRWALGSIADKLLHAAPVPLILVRVNADAA
jgi:nucleotide-binding universal stress UspA family protein